MTSRTIDTEGIAALLGLTRQHVTDRLTKRRDFPRPVIDLSRRTRRWREADVLAYAGGRYKIIAGECRISAPGGPVLRYLVHLSRIRMAYSALG